MDERTKLLADKLSRMIQKETISSREDTDKTKFYEFQGLLENLFPNLFAACEKEDYNGSFVLLWKGKSDKEPLLFMNHQDVVPASGSWEQEPFSGAIVEETDGTGKLWGRGTLDDKGGLFGMLEAADELIAEGYVPENDIWFESATTEETDGSGAALVAESFRKRDLRFAMVLDEGGAVVYDPIGGAKDTFAMVGVGEKRCVDLHFVARSNGGHASAPDKNTPLVRLGKFMAEMEKRPFDAKLSDTTIEMFRRVAPSMKKELQLVLENAGTFAPILKSVLPSFSATANAILRTTLAFTMAKGSDARNVLPQEAVIGGDMRVSHHEGIDKALEKIRAVADKYDIEVVVDDPGIESAVSSFETPAFRKMEDAVSTFFPGVKAVPYVTNTASDARYFSRFTDSCFRFMPFTLSDRQLASIHGINENINLQDLPRAVDFYKYLMTK